LAELKKKTYDKVGLLITLVEHSLSNNNVANFNKDSYDHWKSYKTNNATVKN